MQRMDPKMVAVNGADRPGLGYSRLTPVLVGRSSCRTAVPALVFWACLRTAFPGELVTEPKSWQDQQ